MSIAIPPLTDWLFFVLVLYFPTNIDKYYQILTNIIEISYSLRQIHD